jgi:hypothetical protein
MRLVTVAAAVVMTVAGSAVASGLDHRVPGVMNDEALKQALTDKTIHLSTPLGHLPIRFRADGTMSATANPDLASYVGSARDRGRWWIVSNQLCQRWNSWLDGRLYCFKLRQHGRMVYWMRNDGLTGVATITH